MSTFTKSKVHSLYLHVFAGVLAASAWFRSAITVPPVDLTKLKQTKDNLVDVAKDLLLVTAMQVDERLKWVASSLAFDEKLTQELISAYQDYPSIVPKNFPLDVLIRQFAEWRLYTAIRNVVTNLLTYLGDTLAIRETVIGQTAKDGVGMLIKQAEDEAAAGAAETDAMKAAASLQSTLQSMKTAADARKKGKDKSLADGQQNLTDVMAKLDEALSQNQAMKQQIQDLQHQIALGTPSTVKLPSTKLPVTVKGGTKTNTPATPGRRKNKR